MQELVVLSANLRSPKQQSRAGYEGIWGQNAATFSNEYFKYLLSETWTKYQVTASGKQQYVSESSTGHAIYMLPTDLNLRFQADFKAIAQDYASDETLFMNDFAAAWTKLMTMDRFDGPTGNLCKPYYESVYK
jgi:catalase-peroxidase